MKYFVTYKVEGRYTAEVDADSLKDAKVLADYDFQNSDFGSLEDIDGEAINAEDEDGDRIWEK